MPRGQKTCPACNEPNGPRATVCKKCNAEFPSKRSSAPAKPKASAPQVADTKPDPQVASFTRDMFIPNILTPNGACPIKPSGYVSGVFPDGYTDDTIKDWTRRLRLQGKDKGVNYTPSAIKYWARTYWDIHSEEFANVKQQIDDSFVTRVETEDAADTPAA